MLLKLFLQLFILGLVMVDKIKLALLEAAVVVDFVVVDVVVNVIVVVSDHIIFSCGQ